MTSCPSSELAFSQVREDPLIEGQVVEFLAQRQNHPLRVLLIASGGCTALSLLSHPAIAQVVAVDLNPAQLHLLELRRQVIGHCSPVDQQQLLGIRFWPTTSQSHLVGENPIQRSRLYDQLRPYLPVATRQFWDDRPDVIAWGVNQAGRFETLFRELATWFATLPSDPLRQPQQVLKLPQWPEVFAAVFERQKLIHTFGEAAVNYSMDRSFGEHFADVFAKAMTRFHPLENYFLSQVWAECYLEGDRGCPPYLQPSVQAEIGRLGTDRLLCYQAAFADALTDLDGPFDLIQCSNISDWMPLPDLHRLLDQASTRLAKGGVLLGRRLNGDHHLATVISAHLVVDQAWSHHLWCNDRSFFYREVVVGIAPSL